MKKQERIVCAAVKAYVIPHENCHAQPFDHIFKVIDYEDYKEEDLYRNLEVLDDPVFGFFTSKKRFVDAKEAMRIAIDAKQMIDINSVISDINLEIEAIEFLIKENNIDEKFSTKKLESLRRKLTRFLKIENRDELKPEDLY